MGRYSTRVVAFKEDGHCFCDRSNGENCRCGSAGYIDYGIWDRKLRRFTRHKKVGYVWRGELIKKVKGLNNGPH